VSANMYHMMKSITLKSCLCAFFWFSTLVLAAAPVEKDIATRMVSSWLKLRPQKICQLGTEVAESQTYATTNGATFHVVNVKNGGFVVTSADTDIEPIIAFSKSGGFKKDEKSPLWTLICKDLAERAKALAQTIQTRKMTFTATAANSTVTMIDTPSGKWTRLIGKNTPVVTNVIRLAKLSATSAGSEKAYVEDVRVPPLLKTKWDQRGTFDFLGQKFCCYNHDTPNNYPCGCVATAGAQVMYYHRYPEKIATSPRITKRCHVDGVPTDLTIQGGCYPWDYMPITPVDGTIGDPWGLTPWKNFC